MHTASVTNCIDRSRVYLTELSRAERRSAAIQALRDVGLPERCYAAHPYQLSGGERQRVCIARALAPRPEIVVCDEPVSSLDQSTQTQVIQLLRDLQVSHELTYLFISHDLSVVNQLCGEVAVMKGGEIIERGLRQQVLSQPQQPYTRALLDAARYFSRVCPSSFIANADRSRCGSMPWHSATSCLTRLVRRACHEERRHHFQINSTDPLTTHDGDVRIADFIVKSIPGTGAIARSTASKPNGSLMSRPYLYPLSISRSGLQPVIELSG